MNSLYFDAVYDAVSPDVAGESDDDDDENDGDGNDENSDDDIIATPLFSVNCCTSTSTSASFYSSLDFFSLFASIFVAIVALLLLFL